MRVAYLINQYPKVSHSFIRREIQALERAGVDVVRIALRGWDDAGVDATADASDVAEKQKTRYVLQGGVRGLLVATLRCLLTRPVALLGALANALGFSRQSVRPLPFHLVYLAEACVLVHWMQELECDHLHAHFGTNSAEVAHLCRRLGGPGFSFTVHGPEEFDMPMALHLAEKVHLARFVVAISSFGRAQLQRWVAPEDWHKIFVVHCGLDQRFLDQPATPPPDVHQLVCVGRLCEQKGQLLLLHAIDQLCEQGVAVSLVLAGDGEMRAEVQALIAELGLADHVRITGWIGGDQVRSEILNARALVLPSFAEGLPVVLMEAMALGRPVVSTYIAGIPELVKNGENGWLVPAGDVHALVAVIRQALECDIQHLTIMGERARERARQRHNIDTEAHKLVTHFSAALGKA